MLLADLKGMAAGLGISGAGSMKKATLVEAIKAAQSGQSAPSGGADRSSGSSAPASPARDDQPPAPSRTEQSEAAKATAPAEKQQPKQEQKDKQDDQRPQDRQQKAGAKQGGQKQAGPSQGGQKQGGPKQGGEDQKSKQSQKGQQQSKQQGPKQGQAKDNRDNQDAKDQKDADGAEGQNGHDDEDGEGGSRRNRRRRGRDRTGRAGREPDTEVREDDVLVPAAGILDVLDNYAFVRTTGYLASADDVYLSLSMVRKYNLRRGDALTGQVRQPREGERREKFNPMVRIDAVNGVEPEHARSRVEFDQLTPVSPVDRLRLETSPEAITGRVLDLLAPLGKGQRGLVLSPADAGKTATLQAVANAITTNNPECHLMVVLVDQRPEEVTDFQRAVKGEVIASTFDRPAVDHTTLAELAIERAKRLVELGHDVVVLLDGLTRLGRAYNLTASTNGRLLPGGVDAAALYPPKRFFGAARNVENGGSLTMVATALVESGSKIDEAILEEFTGTSNQQVRLSGELAERGLFPAIDVRASRTRRVEELLGKEEASLLSALRDELEDDPGTALTQLINQVTATRTNYELLMRVQRSAGRS